MALATTLRVETEEGSATFRFAATNDGDEPVTLTFGSGQTAEFLVSETGADGGESVVWRWSDGRAFAQRVRRETLAPGESVTAAGSWDDPPAGEYEVTATLTATDQRPTARARVEV